jgi:DNA-binding NtrC family response regulator
VSTRKRVMIVDDEPIVGERLRASLELAGFIVDAFVSSEDALRQLKQEDYDILVTDLKMSGPDGMEVLRTARQIRPRIKSVVITGFATTDTAEQARLSGALEFIAKPFKISELKSLLMTLAETDGMGCE